MSESEPVGEGAAFAAGAATERSEQAEQRANEAEGRAAMAEAVAESAAERASQAEAVAGEAVGEAYDTRQELAGLKATLADILSRLPAPGSEGGSKPAPDTEGADAPPPPKKAAPALKTADTPAKKKSGWFGDRA